MSRKTWSEVARRYTAPNSTIKRMTGIADYEAYDLVMKLSYGLQQLNCAVNKMEN